MTRIPNHYTKEKLKNICGACGKVLDVQIEQTNAEYCSKSAIIEMESEESCKKIITKYNEKCAPGLYFFTTLQLNVRHSVTNYSIIFLNNIIWHSSVFTKSV